MVTTVRQDVSHGLISKESPMGSALMGKKVGDRFYVQVNKDFGYYAVVRAIEKGPAGDCLYTSVHQLIGKMKGQLSSRSTFATFRPIYAETCGG